MLNIKVFSDFACPFCYIALEFFSRLEDDGVEFELEWIPYEMNPDIPGQGQSIKGKHPKGYYEKMLEFQNKLGQEYNIEFSQQTRDYNTSRALLAGEYAKSLGKYEDFAREVFKAYFYDLKNIGDRKVLNGLVGRLGFDPDEMNSLIDGGEFLPAMNRAQLLSQDFEIQGSPSFLINDKEKMSGMRPYEQMKDSFLAFKA